MTHSAFNLWCVHTASCWWGMQWHCIPHQQLAVCTHHCVHTILNCTLQMVQFPCTYNVHNYSADIAVLQLHCVLPLQRSYIFAELSLCSKFPTVKVLFLFMAGASVAACVTVLVHLRTKESMRVCTTVCYQEEGPSSPCMMVTGRDWTVIGLVCGFHVQYNMLFNRLKAIGFVCYSIPLCMRNVWWIIDGRRTVLTD